MGADDFILEVDAAVWRTLNARMFGLLHPSAVPAPPAKAHDRAMQLLFSMLTPKQIEDFTNRGYFDVTGSAGSRFRIWDRGPSGNVELLDGPGGYMFCAACPQSMPNPDHYLAQALYLITDEPGFMRVAVPQGMQPFRIAYSPVQNTFLPFH